jgi:hypothetical protein
MAHMSSKFDFSTMNAVTDSLTSIDEARFTIQIRISQLGGGVQHIFEYGRPAHPWTLVNPSISYEQADYLLFTEQEHTDWVAAGNDYGQ